jgi:hypothetical protein
VAGEALDVGQRPVLGDPVQGEVARPRQGAGSRLQGDAERRGVAAARGVGHDADAYEDRPLVARAERQRQGAEEHGVHDDRIHRLLGEDRP